jgi:hypothetical protein
MTDSGNTFKQAIQEKKNESFVNPDNTSDSEAIGVLVASYFEWTGEPIIDTFLEALEDANFHTLRAALLEVIEKVEPEMKLSCI